MTRLKWHVGDNLRWLADQSERPDYMPCGMLTGAFLLCVADNYERLAKADRNGNRQDNEDWLGPKDESGGPEGICPKSPPGVTQ